MKVYNEIAGGSLKRIAGLSDGVFGFAMTILVLDLRVPFDTVLHYSSDATFLAKFQTLAPTFATFLMAFMTLGIFWVGQQTMMDAFSRSDRNLTWIYLGFLAAVTLVPFSTWMLLNSPLHVTLLLYWFNMLMLGLILLAGVRYAHRAGLYREECGEPYYRAHCSRIYWAQSLYIVCASLCFINIDLSIGALLAIQLIFALAPGIRILYRL